MQILKNDTITFKVVTRTEKFIFTKLSAAIDCLNNLKEVSYLSFDASNGTSSVTAGLMKKNKDLQIEVTQSHYLKQILDRKAS